VDRDAGTTPEPNFRHPDGCAEQRGHHGQRLQAVNREVLGLMVTRRVAGRQSLRRRMAKRQRDGNSARCEVRCWVASAHSRRHCVCSLNAAVSARARLRAACARVTGSKSSKATPVSDPAAAPLDHDARPCDSLPGRATRAKLLVYLAVFTRSHPSEADVTVGVSMAGVVPPVRAPSAHSPLSRPFFEARAPRSPQSTWSGAPRRLGST